MHQKLQFQTEIFHPGSNPHLGWQLAESNEACLDQENALYTYLQKKQLVRKASGRPHIEANLEIHGKFNAAEALTG